jgi:DNA-directed RNA polymerase specialized sigma subunit
MDFSQATNTQLQTIIRFDKDCPTHLLSGVVTELLNRRLLDGLMKKAIMKRFTKIDIAVKVLKMEEEDLFQFCQMKIFESLHTFKPGLQTFVYFASLYLIGRLEHLETTVKAKKREIYNHLVSTESKEGNTITTFIPSAVNVERTVINKIMIENSWNVLNETEKKAIVFELKGYERTEIAAMFGFHRCYGSDLLKRAYAKLRKQMGA